MAAVVVVAALTSAGAPASAAAATSNTATQAVAAFPTFPNSFFIRNPAQQGKCVTPRTPSYTGPLTMQACNRDSQLFFATILDAGQQHSLIPTFGDVDPTPCLGANSANEVYLSGCDGAINRQWQHVGRTIRNRASGRCLSANSANQVYMGPCDGAINRNWDFPASFGTADSEAVRAATEARRAELASLAG